LASGKFHDEKRWLMEQRIVDRNAASRQRLRELVAGLDEASLRQPVGDGWTVAGVLAHLAFWDQSTLVRWDDYVNGGELLGLADAVIDVVNAASLPTWLALPGSTAVDLALQAAESVDARIEALPADAVDQAESQGLRFLLERSGHRTEHLDQIEASLGR
jgi:Mycothiol maleylpyruvate isomerase N-terminal domain